MMQVAQAVQTNLIRLATLNSEAIGQLWEQVDDLSDEAMSKFAQAAAAQTLAAQTQSASLTYAFLAQAEGISPGPAPAIVDVLSAVRQGVSPLTVYARPMVAARTAISRSQGFTEALQRGSALARSSGETDVMLAHRQAAVSWTDHPKSNVTGHRRVPDSGACDFCLLISTRRYNIRDLQPVHNHCHCTVVPIIGRNDPGVQASNERLKAIQAKNKAKAEEAKPIKAVIKEHGELGPVLTKAGDTFTKVPTKVVKATRQLTPADKKREAALKAQIKRKERKLELLKQWDENLKAARKNGGLVFVDTKTLKPLVA